ncbi:MAG: Pseudouridine synthase [Desulfotomaculum sp. 46_296]|nr:MAG: Pseudouridine synthase [Desulfotomaculum sp. 46_296]
MEIVLSLSARVRQPVLCAPSMGINQGAKGMAPLWVKEDGIYFTTAASKNLYSQLRANPKVELCFIIEPVPIEIVYEDEDFLAVNKPAGISTHPSRPGGVGTLANAVTYYWQGLGRNTLFRPINRLTFSTESPFLITPPAITLQNKPSFGKRLMPYVLRTILG